MQPNQNPSKTSAEDTWATAMLQDIYCGCILNMKLRRAGLCPMYFSEMKTQSDYHEYGVVLEELLKKPT